jgi:hypothetical protein
LTNEDKISGAKLRSKNDKSRERMLFLFDGQLLDVTVAGPTYKGFCPAQSLGMHGSTQLTQRAVYSEAQYFTRQTLPPQSMLFPVEVGSNNSCSKSVIDEVLHTALVETESLKSTLVTIDMFERRRKFASYVKVLRENIDHDA